MDSNCYYRRRSRAPSHFASPRMSESRIRRLIRSFRGGKREKMPPSGPRTLSPASPVGAAVPVSWIFRSADARAPGFPVVRPPISSARYSRSRWTAGSKNLLNGSQNRKREATVEKTLNRESWFLMCIISWATTASASSRSREPRRPVDTTTTWRFPLTAIAIARASSVIRSSTGGMDSNRRTKSTYSASHRSLSEGGRFGTFRRTRAAPPPVRDHRRQGDAQDKARGDEDPEEDRDRVEPREQAHAELRVPRVRDEHVREGADAREAGEDDDEGDGAGPVGLERLRDDLKRVFRHGALPSPGSSRPSASDPRARPGRGSRGSRGCTRWPPRRTCQPSGASSSPSPARRPSRPSRSSRPSSRSPSASRRGPCPRAGTGSW